MEQSPSHRVVVTGAGIVSPLGFGLAATDAALRAGEDVAGPVGRFDVSGCRAKEAAQVCPRGLAERVRASGTVAPERLGRFHHASLMLLAAGAELMGGNPGFSPELAVIGTTGGGMTWGETFYREAIGGRPLRGVAAGLAEYPPESVVLDLCRALGFAVPIQIVANACASGNNAIGHAFTLIRSGLRGAVLCGGFDALSELVFAGFDSLQATTTDKCRPFDAGRSGLLIGEGAALLALESLGSARRRGAPILGEIVGYGVSTDTHHLTRPHPSGIGPRLAMERALASASCSPDEIDAINAHGTATLHNDVSEGAALSELFPGKPVSSTKPMTGHTLGAAGAIEAVISMLSITGQFLPPNLHLVEPEPQWTFEVVRETRPAKLQRVLSNSFGFGGSNASIILQSPP